MEIYNTLTRKLEEFSPIEDQKVRMFACGPTVYDYIHIGNARTFVIFDSFAKYLRHQGYEVNYIQNITDIDNKIIERAEKERVDSLEYAHKFTEIFKADMAALGVTAPEYKSATDHIPEVVKQVQTLLDNGHAYLIEDDGIYFDLSTFSDYGKLSGRTASMANDAVSRIDDSGKKRNRGDFALWKFSNSGDPAWSFETGKYLGILPDSRSSEFLSDESAEGGQSELSLSGRPGWHIEDTAITDKYFGPQYDIHGGGQDLMFPHHEAEIAQQESASGKKPFVKYWMHAGFLVTKDEKMSKSLGNFLTLHKALEKYPPETLRFYFLSAHYRSPLEFNDEVMEASKQGIDKIKTWLGYIDLIINQNFEPEEQSDFSLESFDTHLEKALADDFNTPAAMSTFFTLINSSNGAIQNKKLGASEAKKLKEWLISRAEIFGIAPKLSEIPKEITELIEEREEAKKQKDFARSDEIRSQIEQRGYQIDDTPFGPLVSKN
ncbi:MAG TPA: cysteine--tRNA ligase [Candidatus Paceibacterota bacterium]|nr:cysteine--tRNA ligase [Candidatus Paceibacterota bacterium]